MLKLAAETLYRCSVVVFPFSIAYGCLHDKGFPESLMYWFMFAIFTVLIVRTFGKESRISFPFLAIASYWAGLMAATGAVFFVFKIFDFNIWLSLIFGGITFMNVYIFTICAGNLLAYSSWEQFWKKPFD